MVGHDPNYCPTCGTELGRVEREGRERAFCPDCDRVVFRNAVPTVGVCVVDGDRVLCVRHGPTGRWSVPAGHPEYDEGPREAAVRELAEEAGVRADPAALSLLVAENERVGDEHRFSVGFAVPWSRVRGDPSPGADAEAVRWVTPAEAAHEADAFLPFAVRRGALAVAELGDDGGGAQ